MSPDVIVVGGGVIGSVIAYSLAKAGASVTICDRGAVGQASAASAGLLIPVIDGGKEDPFSGVANESLRLHAGLAGELLERTGIDTGYRSTGLLQVAITDDEAVELEKRCVSISYLAEPPAWLDRLGAREEEPALTPQVRAALYHKAYQLTVPTFVRALRRAAADLGADVREGCDVDSLVIEGDRVAGIRTGSDVLRATEVVLAGGAWSGAWAGALRVPIPVRPVRGQFVALQTPRTAVRHIIQSGAGYVVQKAEGYLYIGATVEEVGFDARSTVEGISLLLDLARRAIVGLEQATFVEAGAGLRPGSQDGLPLIGRLPGWSGVTLATGHYRDGVLLAPITAELVSELLCKGHPRLSLEPFNPARFLTRVA